MYDVSIRLLQAVSMSDSTLTSFPSYTTLKFALKMEMQCTINTFHEVPVNLFEIKYDISINRHKMRGMRIHCTGVCGMESTRVEL